MTAQPVADFEAKPWLRIMRRLGIVGATYGEIADQVVARMDGQQRIIDLLRQQGRCRCKCCTRRGA